MCLFPKSVLFSASNRFLESHESTFEFSMFLAVFQISGFVDDFPSRQAVKA